MQLSRYAWNLDGYNVFILESISCFPIKHLHYFSPFVLRIKLVEQLRSIFTLVSKTQNFQNSFKLWNACHVFTGIPIMNIQPLTAGCVLLTSHTLVTFLQLVFTQVLVMSSVLNHKALSLVITKWNARFVGGTRYKNSFNVHNITNIRTAIYCILCGLLYYDTVYSCRHMKYIFKSTQQNSSGEIDNRSVTKYRAFYGVLRSTTLLTTALQLPYCELF